MATDRPADSDDDAVVVESCCGSPRRPSVDCGANEASCALGSCRRKSVRYMSIRRRCCVCGEEKSKGNFSNRQWAKPPVTRKCVFCTAKLQHSSALDSDTHDAIEHNVRMLVMGGSFTIKRNAAVSLGSLALNSDENKVAIAEAGAIGPLVELLSSWDIAARRNSSVALGNLALNDDNSLLIAETGAIPTLIELLSSSDLACRQNAAGVLWNLSLNDENSVRIANDGAIPSLVELLRSEDLESRQTAADALGILALNDENKVTIANAGAIAPLVKLLGSEDIESRQNAADALGSLAVDNGNAESIAKEGAIPLLAELLYSDGAGCRREAAAALRNLACCSNMAVPIARAGAIPPLVQLMRSDDVECRRYAVGAIGNLTRDSRSNSLVVQYAGGVAPLIACLCDTDDMCVDAAVEALHTLWQSPEPTEIRRHLLIAGLLHSLCIAPPCSFLDADSACSHQNSRDRLKVGVTEYVSDDSVFGDLLHTVCSLGEEMGMLLLLDLAFGNPDGLLADAQATAMLRKLNQSSLESSDFRQRRAIHGLLQRLLTWAFPDGELPSADRLVPRPEAQPGLGELFGCQFLDEEFSDVKFDLCDDQPLVPGHRIILTQRSQYFKIMFSGGFNVDLRDGQCHVAIRECPRTVFIDILRYLYTGELLVVNDENVYDLLEYGDKFLVQGVKALAEHHLLNRTQCIESAWEVRDVANSFSAEHLAQACVEVVLFLLAKPRDEIGDVDELKCLTKSQSVLVTSCLFDFLKERENSHGKMSTVVKKVDIL